MVYEKHIARFVGRLTEEGYSLTKTLTTTVERDDSKKHKATNAYMELVRMTAKKEGECQIDLEFLNEIEFRNNEAVFKGITITPETPENLDKFHIMWFTSML